MCVCEDKPLFSNDLLSVALIDNFVCVAVGDPGAIQGSLACPIIMVGPPGYQVSCGSLFLMVGPQDELLSLVAFWCFFLYRSF